MYFEGDNIGGRLCAAGLTSTPDDAPVWYGAILSFQDFVRNIARNRDGIQLQTFGHGQLDVANTDDQGIAADIQVILRNDLEHAANTVAESRRSAEQSRAAQPKYTAQHPPGSGKGSNYARAAERAQAKEKARRKPRPQPHNAVIRTGTIGLTGPGGRAGHHLHGVTGAAIEAGSGADPTVG